MGFAKEIKDFIGGFEAGQKILGAKDDRAYKKSRKKYLDQQIEKGADVERQGLEKDILRSRATYYRGRGQHSGALDALRSERLKGEQLNNKIRELNYENLRKPTPNRGMDIQVGPQSSLGAIPGQPIHQMAGWNDPAADPEAVDADSAVPSQDVAYNDEEDDGEFDDGAVPQEASHGGVIRRYADGGDVEEDEPVADNEADESNDPANDPDVPADTGDESNTEQPDEAGGALPTATSAPQRGGSAKFSMEAGHDAAREGLTYLAETHELSARSAVSSPRSTASARAHASGAGAFSPDEVKAVEDKVIKAYGGREKLSDDQLHMATLGAIYQFHMGRGEFEEAKRSAGGFMQFYKQSQKRYAALAAVAVEKGHTQQAITLAQKSYSFIPDGRHLDASEDEDGKIKWAVVDDKTGKAVDGGLATPEQFASHAIGMAAHGFDEAILDAAGQREAGKGKGKGESSGLKPSDMKTMNELSDDAETKQTGLRPEDAPAIPPADAADVKSAATQIVLNKVNRAANVMPRDAQVVAAALSDPDPSKPKGQFKRTDGGQLVKFGNAPPVFVPQAQFDQLMAIRVRGLPQVDDSGNPIRKPQRPGMLSSAIDAGRRLVATGKPRQPEPPVVHPNRFTLPSTVPLDEAPAGAIPNRGLGEY